MSLGMSAKGYTHVIMALNMRRFVQPADQDRFESLRGSLELTEILRSNAARWQDLQKFQLLRQYMEHPQEPGQPGEEPMSAEEVGFATGVFRPLMLERFSTPTYQLDKSQVKFDEALASNFQFKTLFLRVWNRWNIYIRPTFSGFFVIRLTLPYRSQARSFMQLAKDVMRLQESLDVPSAQRRLVSNQEIYKEDPAMLDEKTRSVQRFLQWMGAEQEPPAHLLYYPLQWKLAMEVAGLFVEAVGDQIEVPNQEPIRLQRPKASLSIPLHDSYIIHHFDEMLADPADVKRVKLRAPGKARVKVDVNDIRKSHHLKRSLMSLIEGSILRDPRAARDSEGEEGFYFPEPRWSITDSLDANNQASWNDELCLLAGRTAIISPSPDWRNHEIAVSTVPSATLRAHYVTYWDAVERMIEFVTEIRILAQLVEGLTYDLLGEIIPPVHATRSKLFLGDIQMDKNLPDLITRAARLRRLTALVQSLSHPMLWSRAEYAVQKAEYLMDQLGLNKIIEHIQRTIEGITSVADPVDELYLADLGEKNNEKGTIVSVSLAAASLTLTFLTLPSFWQDVGWFVNGAQPTPIQMVIGIIGTVIAAILVVFAVGILWATVYKRRLEMRLLFHRLINGKQ